jgi:HAD superfamily hydrolase (TIGR01484 family)
MLSSRIDVNAAPPEHRTGGSSRLLVTDVDDTLLGDDAAFRALVATLDASPGIAVVLNSSRPLVSLHRTLTGLDTDWRPAGIIGALGTEIELPGHGTAEWDRRFRSFDRRPIDEAMKALGCEPHGAEFQTPRKASFAVPQEMRPRARHRIGETGVPVTIIESGDSNFDVIPEGAGKAAALRWVAGELAIPMDRTIAAGDSRNDRDMLLVAARGIVVGNASPRLRSLVDTSSIYFAEHGYAAGILEGLRHFGVPLHESGSA